MPGCHIPLTVGKQGKTYLGNPVLCGLVDQVSAHTSPTRAETGAVIDAVLEVIVDVLRSGETVGLPGLAVFGAKATAARQGVHSGTSEKITIPAGKKVSYRVALHLE